MKKMRLLLDTHVLIWFLSKKSALSDEIRALIVDPGNKKFLSVASIWEMTIKDSLGKLKLLTFNRNTIPSAGIFLF